MEEEMGVETELTTNGEENGGEDGGENGDVREGETKETKVATSTVVSQTVTAWEEYLLDEEEEGKYFKIERERVQSRIWKALVYITVFIISNFFFVLTFKNIILEEEEEEGEHNSNSNNGHPSHPSPLHAKSDSFHARSSSLNPNKKRHLFQSNPIPGTTSHLIQSLNNKKNTRSTTSLPPKSRFTRKFSFFRFFQYLTVLTNLIYFL